MGSPPQIDGFTTVKLLGTGGFSDVYVCQQDHPSRLVAIKVLSRATLSDQLRRQFTAEANLMARVSTHPSIATVYAAGADAAEQPYLVMEYCPGGSLGSRYRHDHFSAREVLHIGVRLASALETAHRAGIVHRDVKPANVLINDYGSALLTDFGISAILDEFPDATRMREEAYATRSPIDSTPESLGLSIPWSAPETFDDEPHVDARSDVFSLAATLFSLLANRTPFERPGAANGAARLMARIQAGALEPLNDPDVPDALTEALMTGLAHNPAHRFQTALAFAERLQNIQTTLSLPPTPIETTSDEMAESGTVTRLRTELPTPVPDDTTSDAAPPPRRSRALIIVSSVAAAALIALAAVVGVPIAASLWAADPAPVPTTPNPPPSSGDDETATPDPDTTTAADDGLPPFLDDFGVTVAGDDVTLDFPSAQAPPEEFTARVVSTGDSDTVVGPESTVSFSYITSEWLYDQQTTATFPAVGESPGSPATTPELAVGIGSDVDVMGLPVGTVIVTAAPAGMFLFVGPFDDAEFGTQIVVIRIDAVS